MGHLICIDKCYNSSNQPYRIGMLYKYYDDRYIDVYGTKFYYIFKVNRVITDSGIRFDGDDDRFGIGRKEFIDKNFMTISQWSSIYKEINKLFDNFYDGSG